MPEHHMAFKGQKWVPDSLDLELETEVSGHVGAGNPTRVLCKSSKFSSLWSHLSSAQGTFFF